MESILWPPYIWKLSNSARPSAAPQANVAKRGSVFQILSLQRFCKFEPWQVPRCYIALRSASEFSTGLGLQPALTSSQLRSWCFVIVVVVAMLAMTTHTTDANTTRATTTAAMPLPFLLPRSLAGVSFLGTSCPCKFAPMCFCLCKSCRQGRQMNFSLVSLRGRAPSATSTTSIPADARTQCASSLMLSFR